MKKRIFIAFNVSDKVKKELTRIQNILKQLNKKARVKWTRYENFHVTVDFIGEIEESAVEKVKKITKEIAQRNKKFSYWLDYTDAFPNRARPKILTVRLREEHERGKKIYETLHKKLQTNGFTEDLKPWKPHITIGRNKAGEQIDGLNNTRIKKNIWQINSIELMESKLTNNGSIYTTLESFHLKE